MKVTVKTNKNITGKILYYLRLENDYGTDKWINIGEGTYKAVDEMIKEEEEMKKQPKLKL